MTIGFEDQNSFRRMADSVRWTERQRGIPDPSNAKANAVTPIFARSTGTVVDTDFAEGFVVVFDGQTPVDYGACYLTTIDNQPPAEGMYFGRITGTHTSGAETRPVVRIGDDALETICFQVVTAVTCNAGTLSVTTKYIRLTGSSLSVTVTDTEC